MDFEVIQNDIANMEVDAVVLPANWKLQMGTGASMAIFEAAGCEQLEAECAMRLEQAKSKNRRLVPGISVPTHAFDLPAKVIIHTIVPKWNEKHPRQSYEDLCKSYASALVLADEMGLESIAFPLLASGNNRFDPDIAIDIALQSLDQYKPVNKLAQAYLVTFGSSITQKLRDRGYAVEEAIDQLRVLDQDAHQAEVLRAEREKREAGLADKKALPQKAFDNAVEWLGDPKNQKKVLGAAIAVANVVLKDEGKPGKIKNVLNALSPLIDGKKQRH